MTGRLRAPVMLGIVAGMLCLGVASAEPPARPAGQSAALPPRNTGPAARAHSRSRRGRHGTTRIIRRTPEVMREDAARVKRGDLFSTWSNEYLE